MKNLSRPTTLTGVIFLIISALILSACTLPHSQVASGTVRPTLAVTGTPLDALLYIDNVLVGPVAQYDGHRNVLKIEEGMHRVSVIRNGDVLHEEKIYAAPGENKIIEVGGQQ
jgi:hypothetical protein